jgi:hypothetical protein
MAKQFQVDTGGTLTTNLVAYFKLSDVNDYYGSFNLTNTNSVAFNTGKVGNAADTGASNTDKRLSVANDLGVTNGNFSVSLWINVTTAPATDTSPTPFTLIDEGTDVNYEIRYADVAGTKKLRFNRGKENVANQFSDYDVTLTTGTWYHIVYTYDGTNIRGYVNNVLRAGPTAASGNGSGSSGEGLFLFVDYGLTASKFFSGLIDEIGIWTKALTTTEINDLYNAGNGQTMTNVQTATLTETPTLSDVLLKLPSRILSETASLADTLVRLPQRLLSEAATLADSIVRSVVRTLSETPTISDVLATLKLITANMTLETIALGNTIVRSVQRVVAETATIGDTAIKAAQRVLSETTSLTELFTRGLTYVRVLVESLTLTEIIRKYLNGLESRWSGKYAKPGTSWTDKYSGRGTSWQTKYPPT